MKIQCPECQSDAVYRYGRVASGKQRFLCLLCDRQFVANPENVKFKNKPPCPECGKPMHSYMKGGDHIRFRCSDYPRCRTYLKMTEVEFEVINAEMISTDFSLKTFIDNVEGKPTWEAFHLTNEESTAANRFLMSAKQLPDEKRDKIKQYLTDLNQFMLFIQSTIRIPRKGRKSNDLFWRYWDSVPKNKMSGRVA
jgi:transposase-like protein